MKYSLIAAALIATAFTARADNLVSKDVGDPSANPWREGGWPTTTGSFTFSEERPGPDANKDHPDWPAPSQDAKSLEITVHYGVRSFGGWSVDYTGKPLPGRPYKVSYWSKRGTPEAGGMGFALQDANTNSFSIPLEVNSDDWAYYEYFIPEKVGKEGVPPAYPIRICDINQNNWGDRNNPNAVDRKMLFYDLRIHTDMEGVPVEERPFDAMLTFPVTANVFYYGKEKPQMNLGIGSWLGEERTAKVTGEVVAADGAKRPLKPFELKCLDSAATTVDLPFAEPGVYTINAKISGLPREIEYTHRYAVVLEPPALTPEQNRMSPYGINIHGGTTVGYENFKRIGFEWVRDYAYNFHWMVRARGAGDYGGWPWYPKLVDAATSRGMSTLACLMHSLTWGDTETEINMEPTDEWRRQLALIVSTFPQVTAWELDNEKDTLCWKYPEKYGAFHRVLGEVVKACVPNAWAIEEGAAGIHEERDLEYIEDGSFKDLDALNGHRYCGLFPPEICKHNANPGQGEARPTLVRDTWRTWKRYAGADGKQRQCWVTEFGWDTLAGQIVTEWEQAAYCQRGYMLGMASGIDKIFWYWYYDSDTDRPSNFFDGCGIYNRFREPKPVVASFAAMRSFLPADMKYLGYANLSPNAMVQMFDVNGKVVAAAFKISKDGPDFTITQPKAEAAYNMFGGRINGSGKLKLDIAPTWYIGLDKNCDWLKQAPMDLLNNYYVRNVGGEPIKVRPTSVGEYEVTQLPEGWRAEKVEGGFDVYAPKGAPRASKEFHVVGTNQGVKQDIRMEVAVVPEAFVRSEAVDAEGVFKLTCANQSAYAKTHTITAELPDGWAVEPKSQTYTLDPDKTTTLEFKLLSSTAIPASEEVNTPKMVVTNEEGMRIDTSPIVPRQWAMKKRDDVKIDGDLGDWNDTFRLPSWMILPRGEDEKSRIWMAYSDKGMYVAMDMVDSKCYCSDPNSFWRATDVLEFFVNTKDNLKKGDPWTVNCHQFWFCPQAEKNNAFAGFWGRADGQEGGSDLGNPTDGLPPMQTAVRKNDSGYTMEIFIPRERINGYNPQKGSKIGIGFTIAVLGPIVDREVSWPCTKASLDILKPYTWSHVTLD